MFLSFPEESCIPGLHVL